MWKAVSTISRLRRLAATGALAALGLAAMEARADILQLKDGRLIEGQRMTKVQGGVKILYKHGEVFVPDRLVLDVLLSNPDGTFKPRNAAEAEKLAKGFVPYRGTWLPRAQYERRLKKRLAENRQRIEAYRSHRKWVNRYKKATRNFAFEYTIPPATAEEYMELFETYYKVFTRAWGIRRPAKIGKLKVCFYHDRAYYNQVSALGSGTLGYFRFVQPYELNVFNIRNDKEMTIDVIFHEVNHYLVTLINPRFHYPTWINEGMAEYYAASDWDPKARRMKVGKLQEGRLVALKDDVDEGDWLKIEDLISMENPGIKPYTWGWSFCHFMMHTPRYTKKFKRFFKALGTARGIKRMPFHSGLSTVTSAEAIRVMKKYLGVKDLAKLNREWHDYIKTKLRVQSARGFEQAAGMAERNGMRITAKEYYEKAIKTGNASARGYHSYARLLYEERKYAEAARLFEKAIERDPLNAYGYMRLGLCRKRLGGKANRARGEKLQRLALEMEPGDENLESLAELKKERRRQP